MWGGAGRAQGHTWVSQGHTWVSQPGLGAPGKGGIGPSGCPKAPEGAQCRAGLWACPHPAHLGVSPSCTSGCVPSHLVPLSRRLFEMGGVWRVPSPTPLTCARRRRQDPPLAPLIGCGGRGGSSGMRARSAGAESAARAERGAEPAPRPRSRIPGPRQRDRSGEKKP